MLLNFSFLFVRAQRRSFFESIELSSYVYVESIPFTEEGWLRQVKSTNPLSAQYPDSLRKSRQFAKEWFRIDVKGGYGIQLRGLRPIRILNNDRELLWKMGIDYHTFEGSDDLSYAPSMPDTTKNYKYESERLQFTQRLIGIYTAVVYNLHIGLSHVSIGLGIQTSFSVSSEIMEHYIALQYRWNSSPPYWKPGVTIDESKILPVKNSTVYSLTIPFGWGIDLSKRLSWELGGEYFHALHSPQLTQKKFSNGAMIQLLIRYKL